MKLRHSRWWNIASVGTVCAVAGALTGLAFASDGVPVTQVDLNDSGVWVTNQSIQRVGRFNYGAHQLDGASYVTETSHFDVVQERSSVFVLGTDDGSLAQLTPATLVMSPAVSLGTGAQVHLAGSMVGILIPGQGKFWLLPADLAASFDPAVEAFPPAVEGLPDNAVSAVGADGTGYVVDPKDQTLTTVRWTDLSLPPDEAVTVKSIALPALVADHSYRLTVVGTTPVAVDAKSGLVLLGPGATASVEAGPDDDPAAVALQDVSAAGDAVVYATQSGLVSQPLKGGAATVTASPKPGGQPAPPVVLDGCSYGVWSKTAAFVRDCPGTDHDLAQTIDGAAPDEELRFRVNWGHIVLNQIESGGVWLVSDRIEKVDDWPSVMEQPNGDQNQDNNQEADDNAQPDRSQENHPPRAVDDVFGARAGESVLLPVVENDVDDDGDLLTAALVGTLPAGYQLTSVYSDSVFQLNVPGDATGEISFRYRVSDGRGGEAEATVRVEIHPPATNAAPERIRATKLTVTSGHRVSRNILTDWRDPDGDAIFLTGAQAPAEDLVTPVQDGSLTFQDGGVSTGTKTITVTVSDGKTSTTGEVQVSVLPAGNQPPVAVPDLVSGIAGMPIAIKPLDNDTDPDGNTLRLTGVDGDGTCAMTKDLAGGLVTAVCPEPGSYYLAYTMTDGPSANVAGWIRVVALAPAASDAPPVAVPDTVLLPPGQDAYLDPLANDVDPLGYPLVLTAVEAPAQLPVSLSVIDYQRVKVTATEDLSAPVAVNYSVSNGHGVATSRITIVPLPPPDKILPPSAVDDTVTVRAGDIAQVAVLANDTSPNGIELRLRPDLPQVPDPDSQALVFASGNLVRLHARQTPGTYTVLYQVENTKGNAEPDTGRLTVHVTAPDQGGNQPPKPKDVEVRTLAGRAVTVNIPLDGIDPDGDSVTLQGLGSAPTSGLITAVTPTSLVYQPGPVSAGGDKFTYVVRDRLGLEAKGTVRVGVAPSSAVNHPPIALTDFAEARPGGTVTVPVADNDTDPDSDPCCVVEPDSVVSDSFTGVVKGQNVIITAPDAVGSYWGTYRVSDGLGMTSTGVISLTVATDVPKKAPIAKDDSVSLLKALTATTETLSVRDNDRDLDGDVEQDTVAVTDPKVTVAGGQVTVPITAEPQIIDYYLTDPDNLVGHAFIFVPGVDRIPPQFNTASPEIKVKAGESVTLSLADYLAVRPGRAPRVTQAAKVTAWNGTATAPSTTEVTFAAPPDYTGPASVSVEVTDGATLEDETGLTSVVTIPITVTQGDNPPPPTPGQSPSAVNQPPAIRNSSLDVEAGQSGTLDLGPLVSNAEPDDKLTYALVKGSDVAGVETAVDGSTLTAKAAITVPTGTQATLTVSVDDGHNPAATGQITVRVVASTKPLPQAVDDTVANANQGVATCVPVTANDVNPFPGQPLTVVAAAVETGAGGQAAAGCDGGQGVSVTPGTTFLGQMVVRYTIQDATHDANRQASGRVYLTVRGRPDPPVGLHIDQVGDKQVILSWRPSNNNGAPITGYTVSPAPAAAGYPRQCQTTTCVLDGLTNNVTYSFTVTATNEVGASDPSLASDSARPDAVPYPVDAPSIDFGDKSLRLSWVPKGSPGSPVESYDLQISPPPPSGVALVNVTGTAYTWSGLANGTEYRVKVCARNAAPGVCEQPSHWSPDSLPMIPAAPPDAPAAPTWSRLQPLGAESQVQVCWNPPFNNGAAIDTYTLSSNGTTYPKTADNCRTVTLPISQADFAFTVTAHNKAGDSAPSAPSAGFRSLVPPGAPGAISVSEGDGFCQVSFGAAASNGARAGEVIYVYQASNGASGDFGASTGGRVNLPNSATGYTITVHARTVVPGQASYDGPDVTSGVCRPYGPPFNPSNLNMWWEQVGIRGTFHWNPDVSGLSNGRPIDSVNVCVDGACGQANSGGISVGNGPDETHSLSIEVTSAGQSARNDVSGRTASPGGRLVWDGDSGLIDIYAGVTHRLWYFAVELWNFPPNSTVTCQKTINLVGSGTNRTTQTYTQQVGTDGNGNGRQRFMGSSGGLKIWGDDGLTTAVCNGITVGG